VKNINKVYMLAYNVKGIKWKVAGGKKGMIASGFEPETFSVLTKCDTWKAQEPRTTTPCNQPKWGKTTCPWMCETRKSAKIRKYKIQIRVTLVSFNVLVHNW